MGGIEMGACKLDIYPEDILTNAYDVSSFIEEAINWYSFAGENCEFSEAAARGLLIICGMLKQQIMEAILTLEHSRKRKVE